ncbi:MAG: hypothetical protein JWM53_5872 [bacterium]|nr:hypothetical protein [bacterium]
MINEDIIVSGPAAPSDVDTVNDVQRAARDYFLVTVFPRSRAGSYRPAIAAAQRAHGYRELVIDGKLQHLAAFGDSADQVNAARTLHDLTWNIRHVQHYVRGRRVTNTMNIHQVLDCYGKALLCPDTRAHCVTIENRGFLFGEMPGGQRYAFPCRLLRHYQPDLDRRHPATLSDQIQAHAIRVGCDWCPLFDAHAFRPTASTARRRKPRTVGLRVPRLS